MIEIKYKGIKYRAFMTENSGNKSTIFLKAKNNSVLKIIISGSKAELEETIMDKIKPAF